MTSKAAAAVTGLLAVALAGGCGNDASGGGPTKPPPQVAFGPSFLSTGGRAVSVAITGPEDVTPDIADGVVSRIRIANFPQGVVAPTTQSITITPRSVSPNGVPVPAFAVITEELDAALHGGEWYAVSLPANPSQYVVDPAWVLVFEGGRLGVLLSPTHPPVVASVMSCLKDAGGVAVYVRYSESLSKTDGALSLDYGTPPVACSVGADSPGETQFICSGTAGGAFSLHVPDGVTAQASGTLMAPTTLDSTGLQRYVMPDGCMIYKPMRVN